MTPFHQADETEQDQPAEDSTLEENGTFEKRLAEEAQTVKVSAADDTDLERLMGELRQRNRQLSEEKQSLELLFEVSRNLVSVAEPQLVAQLALEQIMNVLNILRGEVFEVDEETGRLQVLALVGYDDYAISIYEASAELRLQQGLAWYAAQHKEAIAVPDVNCNDHWVPIPDLDDDICSAAVVPLLADDKMSGMMSLLSDEAGYLNEQRLPLLVAVATPMALALQNGRLFVAEVEARQASETLRAASLEMNETFEVETIAATSLDYLYQLIGYDQAAVVLFHEGNRLFVSAYKSQQTEIDSSSHSGKELSLTSFPYLQKMIETQETVLLTDVLQVPDWRPIVVSSAMRSWFGVPLVSGSMVVGAFVGGHSEPGVFSKRQYYLAETLASQTAAAIQNGQLFNQFRTGQDNLRKLAEQLVNMQEAERQRIARELHDEAGQALNALKVSLALIHDDLPVDLNPLRVQLKDASDLTEQTLQRIRLLSYDLHPPELDTIGLDAAFESFCEEFAQRTRLKITYEGTVLPRLSGVIRITLYRFLQEAVTNIVKHARATNIKVRLTYEDQEVCLTVSDNGRGFEVPVSGRSSHASSGLGLLGMRERLGQLNGTLPIKSIIGQGTELRACIPWEETET